MQKRSVVSVVIFTLISCGIYGLWWVYKTAESFDKKGGPYQFNALITLICCLFVSPVGFAFFGMNADDCLNKLNKEHRLPEIDNKVVYIALGVFLPIVQIALIQDAINKLPDEACDAAI